MAQKPDIQYITQFYVHGSEAKVLELKPKRKFTKTVLPEAAPQKKIRIGVDPVAYCAIVVAVVMAFLLVGGIMQFLDVCQEHRVATDRVIELQNKNVTLLQEYHEGYDIVDIETKALAIGMIPLSEAKTISIRVEIPEAEAEPTLWEEISWRFRELLA